jgi:phosphatidate cytidylyltransferase
LLLTRLLTAAVLLAAFIAALFLLERELFAVLISAVIGLGGFEWARLSKVGRGPAVAWAALCGVLCFSFSHAPALSIWICGFAGVFWIAAVPYWLARGFRPSPNGTVPYVGLIVLIPAGLAAIALPREQLLMVLGLIWIADTGAYLAGRSLGRHKLAPSISPGKTWEGVAGGAIGCIIYAIIWAHFDPDLRALVQGPVWVVFLAGTMLLYVLSVLGDLFESALKRRAGAKDSGTLLPGHGGVLDRIDSATATLPVALLLVQMTGAK